MRKRSAYMLAIYAAALVVGFAARQYYNRGVADPQDLWREPPAQVLERSFTYADQLARWCLLAQADRGIRPAGNDAAFVAELADRERLRDPVLAFHAWNHGLAMAKAIPCPVVPQMIADTIQRAPK